MFDETDACAVPVPGLVEAPLHPLNSAQAAFLDLGGLIQAAPVQRFSRSVSMPPRPPSCAGPDADDIYNEAGFLRNERLRFKRRYEYMDATPESSK